MPGRVRESTTQNRVSRKSSVPTLNSKASTISSSRPSTTNIQVEDEGPISTLREFVCAIFGDSYRSTTGHRKLVVRLRKCMEQCCYDMSEVDAAKGGKKNKSGEERAFAQYEEEEFIEEVKRCVARILGVKKTEGAGDRMVRFLGLFLKTSAERDAAMFEAEQNEDDEVLQSAPETPSSRLTFALLSMLIPLLSAKEKTVRFRATQIISHVINTLEAIDDELYQLIRQGLIKRIRDKEPTIRIQAVLGLGRLAGNEAEHDNEDEDDEDIENSRLLDKLLDALQNDTSAEVRRSLLLNLPLTPATLPYLLERARDLDGPTRRALYARLLPTLGDFRHLSLSMREKLLRWGLRDRDENVRKATGRLFRERWIEDCAGSRVETEDGAPQPDQQVAPASIPALLELLERIDVVNSGVEDGIALEAMKDFWDGRPDYLDAVNFDDEFWTTLTPEASFVARSFNDFCQQNGKYQSLVEEKMPEVTRLGFYLQRYLNNLLDTLKRVAEEGTEEDTVEQEFVVEQLMYMALTLDYSDEIGRRKMFSLLREALAMADLPDEITRLAVEVLRLVCGNDAAGEKEFCGVLLEAIAEVHDNIIPEPIEHDEDDSFVSAKSEVSDDPSLNRSKKSGGDGSSNPGNEDKAIREIMINMKCLHIAQCMLQNVDGNLQQNISLVTMLNNLVVPAVRSHEAPIRERGLVCLGLCCLLDRTLAEENITLFIHCFSKGHEALQVTSLQILCDILVTHPTLLSATEPSTSGAYETSSIQTPPPAHQKPVLKVLSRALRPSSSPPTAQSTAAICLSKLLLTSRLLVPSSSLDDILRVLVSSFFNPATSDNPALRQALAYFLPVYSHSRLENCERMGRVAVGVVHMVMNAADEYYTLEAEEDSDGDVDESQAERKVKTLMGTVVGMLGEWTDGRKLVNLDNNSTTTETGEAAGAGKGENIHLSLSIDILERALSNGCRSSEKKVLLLLLGKLAIPAPATIPSTSTPPSSSHGFGSDMLSSSERQHQDLLSLAKTQLELATTLKALLDEAITEDIARDAVGRNTLVKVKNSVLKLVKSSAHMEDVGRKSMAAGSGRVSSGLTLRPKGESARSSAGDGDVGSEEPTNVVEGEDMEMTKGEDELVAELLEEDEDL